MQSMNVFKKSVMTAAMAALLLLPATACSGQDNSRSSNGTSQTETTQSTTLDGSQVTSTKPVTTSSVSSSNTSGTQTSKAPQESQESQESETQEPPTTMAPQHTGEYTAVELAAKDLDEIKEIMGGDYQYELKQLSNAFSSSGCNYVYNFDVLPGFAFAVDVNGYYGISIMHGAKLNDSISSDMTYDQIADIIGDMDGMLVGQDNNIACHAVVDGYNVTFCFIANDYIFRNKTGGKLPGELLRAGDPGLQSIGLSMR